MHVLILTETQDNREIAGRKLLFFCPPACRKTRRLPRELRFHQFSLQAQFNDQNYRTGLTNKCVIKFRTDSVRTHLGNKCFHGVVLRKFHCKFITLRNILSFSLRYDYHRQSYARKRKRNNWKLRATVKISVFIHLRRHAGYSCRGYFNLSWIERTHWERREWLIQLNLLSGYEQTNFLVDWTNFPLVQQRANFFSQLGNLFIHIQTRISLDQPFFTLATEALLDTN